MALISLKRQKDFNHIRQQGVKAVTKGFILLAYTHSPSENGTYPSDQRIGIIASKKVGNAVFRNRIRRRLKALLRQILPHCAKNGTDYLFIARTVSYDRSFLQLEKDLRYALHQTNTFAHRPQSMLEKTNPSSL